MLIGFGYMLVVLMMLLLFGLSYINDEDVDYRKVMFLCFFWPLLFLVRYKFIKKGK